MKLLNQTAKISNLILNRTEEIFVAVAMAVAVSLAFIEVILRQFGSSLGFTHELVNYLLIWVGLIGASIGVREKTHLGVDILINAFEPKTQKAIIIVTLWISAAFTFTIAILGYQHVLDILAFGQVSPELEVPLYIPRMLIPIAFGLMTIRFIQESIKVIKMPIDQFLQKEGVINE